MIIHFLLQHSKAKKIKFFSSQITVLFQAHKILSDEQYREIYDNYGSVGLELAEQVGPENVAMLMKMQTPCAKFGMCLAFILTGFCCGCFCCCCFCCFFCCGKLDFLSVKKISCSSFKMIS